HAAHRGAPAGRVGRRHAGVGDHGDRNARAVRAPARAARPRRALEGRAVGAFGGGSGAAVSQAASARAAWPTPRAIVGIDLGTSHTSVAFAECSARASVSALPIPQWVEGRRRDERLLLPSVAYAPLPGELGSAEATDDVSGGWVIG